MNCLLLLLILFCCNGNGNCGNGNCLRGDYGRRNCHSRNGCDAVRGDRSCNTGNRHAANGNCDARGDDRGRQVDRDCDCDVKPVSHSCPTPPPMPRTQFPYLDVEPRTCGCEEKSNN